jgi:hypothetical protein
MSGASSRRRGHDYERALAAWLRGLGVEAITSRELNGGRQEGSDLITDLPVCVEAKAHAAFDLAGWLTQAIRDAKGDKAAVFVKARQKPVSESYVVMRADQFVQLVRPDVAF